MSSRNRTDIEAIVNESPESPTIPQDFDRQTLQRVFADAGFCATALAGIADVSRSTARLDVEFALRRTRGGSPFDVLVRLFLLRVAVPREEASKTFAAIALESLAAAGILQFQGDNVLASVSLVPFDDMLLFHDFGGANTVGLDRPDAVMGVGLSSIAVARLAPPGSGRRVLDLGTGSGYLSLSATSPSDSVVATDLNRRALDFVRWNAWLQGRENIDLREGSLFEPVAGERFDLILANPPFAITPGVEFRFRDSGLPGDALSETVLRSVGAHLVEGGLGIISCGWWHTSADAWSERPLSWMKGSGCDAWLMCVDTRDPLGYAAGWLSKSGLSPEAYGKSLDSWVDYYRQQNIGALSWGCIVLRRRSTGENWTRADKVDCDWDSDGHAEQIQRILAAEDILRSSEDESIVLDRKWKLAEEHVLEHWLHAREGQWMIDGARIRLTKGLGFAGNVDRLVSILLASCDGNLTLREVLTKVALSLGADVGRLAPQCAVVMRTLIQQGFLIPVGSGQH